MANLPMDIVNDVFLRLPATTLVRCRVLSKPCFSLIDSPDFVASHLKRTLETEEHLMILLRSPRLLRTVYLDAPDKISDVEHPLQTDGSTEVFGSVNGLVGLTNSPVDLALFNPSTRKIHRLPIEPIDFTEHSISRENVFYGLGYDSVSDDYKVVRMVQSKDRGIERFGYPFEVKVFSLKRNRWKRIREVQILFIHFYYRFLYPSGNGVLAGNSLHWILPRRQGLIAGNKIIRFDLASDDLGVLSFPQELYFEDNMEMGVLDAKQPRDRDGDRKLGRERGRETSNLKFVDTETFPERLLLCPSPYPTILDVPGSPHTYWGRFLCVPETSPSPRRTRYVRRHQVGVPVQPRLDGCLCFMCYSMFSHVEVWILREYQGKWSKFITVESYNFIRPLIYSKDRIKILMEINGEKLVWYDLASKSFETFVIKGCEGLQCSAEIVVSSLVLGCKGDPHRAREKKMLQKGSKRRDDFLSKGFKLKL